MKITQSKKRFLTILVGLALIIFCFFEPASYVPALRVSAKETKENLIVGVPVDRCPVFYTDRGTGDIVGIGVDLMRVAAENAGFNVTFKSIEDQTLKEALDSKEYDIIMPFGSAVDSASGQASVVTDNLTRTPFTFVTVNNRKLPPLKNMRVGMLRSLGGAAETVKELYPEIEITLYDDMNDSVKALKSGKVDALLHNSYVWSYVLQKPAYSKLEVQPSTMFSMDFRAGTLDTEYGQKLVERLNTGISEITDTYSQAVVLDYTTRRLYQYDLFDYIYKYGLIVTIFILILAVQIRETNDLRKAKKKAEEAASNKALFLANMSHEIKNPINSIMGMGELISKESGDSKIRYYADSIDRAAESLLALVNEALDLSRMEAGKLTIRQDPYHLSSLLVDIDMMISGKAKEKNLTYTVEVDENIPDNLIGDDVRLKQVIVNLLSNAVKYTMTGFVYLKIGFEKDGEDAVNLKIHVKDTGIGMKQEDIDKLFNAYERLDEDNNRSIEGTGLGMNIVKNILDAMNTNISVKSVYGAGSVFSFTLRQRVSSWEKIGDYNATARKVGTTKNVFCPDFKAPDVRILSVDDTELNHKLIKGLLEHTGMQIDTALGGNEAQDLLRKKLYDILLIDYRMPGMDGVELLKNIKLDPNNPNHDTVSIALTGNSQEGARDMFINAGFNDYLEKPVRGIILEEMLLKYLPKEKIRCTDAVIEDERLDKNENEFIENLQKSVNQKLLRLQEEGLINIDEGIEYAGSEELLIKTLEFFRDSIDEKADEIEQLYFSENIEDYTVKVHALKSSARLVGAHELSDKAKELEEAGKLGDMDYIRDKNMEMLELYRRYKDILAGI